MLSVLVSSAIPVIPTVVAAAFYFPNPTSVITNHSLKSISHPTDIFVIFIRSFIVN